MLRRLVADGRRILFAKGAQLWVIRPGGRNARRIPHAVGDFLNAVPMRPPAIWSRDGKKVYYRGWGRGHREPTLMVIDANGQHRLDLTPQLTRVFSFALSRDGQRIAVAASAEGQPRDVYVLEADGTRLRNLTPGTDRIANGDAARDDDPQWSPDGTKLAFVRWFGSAGVTSGGPGQIYVMNADGSEQKNLSNNSAGEDAPAWRPRSR